MRKFKLWLIAGGLAVLGVAGVVGTQTGAWSSNIAGEGTVVARDAVHQGSLYAAGQTVRIEGMVEGDVYCGAATSVIVTGTVNGDVICAAQTVTIDGVVRQDVRVAGQAVDIAGEVGGSVSVLAQNFRTGRDLQVEGDINGAVQIADIDGKVGANLVMAVQSMTVNGEVAGNVDVNVAMLRFGSSASVNGDVNYVAANEISIEDGVVSGDVNYLGTSDSRSDASSGGQFVEALLVLLAMFLATASVIVALAPRFVQRSSNILGDQPLNTILLGFAVVFALPIVAVFMMVSVVLIPVAIVALLGWTIVMLLSGVFAAYYIGSVLLRGKPHVLLRMLGGVLVLAILAAIPLFNILVIFVATVVGAGALVATFVHGYRRPQYTIATAKKATKPAKTTSRKKKSD